MAFSLRRYDGSMSIFHIDFKSGTIYLLWRKIQIPLKTKRKTLQICGLSVCCFYAIFKRLCMGGTDVSDVVCSGSFEKHTDWQIVIMITNDYLMSYGCTVLMAQWLQPIFTFNFDYVITCKSSGPIVGGALTVRWRTCDKTRTRRLF